MSAPHPETGAGTAPPDVRSDRQLLAAHQDGDATAFPALVARHRRRFWNLCLRTLRDREEAADALQDGFVRAYRASAGYRGDAEVASWLHRIVLNVCLARIAQRQTAAGRVELDESGSPGAALADRVDEFGRTDARLDVQALLAALPDEQRLPIVLIDLEGYSVAEAAHALELAEGTVKSRCARGRARMAGLVLAQHGGESSAGSTTTRRGGER